MKAKAIPDKHLALSLDDSMTFGEMEESQPMQLEATCPTSEGAWTVSKWDRMHH